MSRFCPFSMLTSNDLSRTQMTSNTKNSNTFISSLVSAFQKHSVWKKWKISLFRSILKYDLRGLKWPETKILSKGFCLTIPHAPHAPHCSSLLLTATHCSSLLLTAPPDMRKRVVTRSLTAEISLDCGNFPLAAVNMLFKVKTTGKFESN